MFRSTVLGSVLAAVLTPVGIFLNHATLQSPVPSVSQSDVRLTDSLSQLSQTLVSFEARQTGSEAALTKQIADLTSAVSQTQQTSQSQIASLVQSMKDVQAATAKNDVEVRQMLNDFATNFEKQAEAKFVKLVEDEAPPVPASKGVGTLDVRSIPADSDIESIQTMSDAARRIISLESAVAALKARCANCNTNTSAIVPEVSRSQVYYETPTYSYQTSGYSAPSGGCTGSYMPVGNYYSQPQQYYAPQTQYANQGYSSQAATTERRGLFGRRYQVQSSGTCRMVNGQQVCN
jgi:hypothetical protein